MPPNFCICNSTKFVIDGDFQVLEQDQVWVFVINKSTVLFSHFLYVFAVHPKVVCSEKVEGVAA